MMDTTCRTSRPSAAGKPTGQRRFPLSILLALLVAFPALLLAPSASLPAFPVAHASGNDPAIEQQIDIQDVSLTTTSPTYTDANGSGSFLWNAARYPSLQHVYFEAGIAKQGAFDTTARVRSADILSALVSGRTYKVRIRYGCSYSSTTNTFTETGSAALWSSDTTTEVTSSEVSGAINTGSGPCPPSPTAVAVRFSRLIILQAGSSRITDTNTTINIGQNESQALPDTDDHPLTFPKIWLYTDHSQHPAAGWDAIKDVLFSATLASPSGIPVSACLYDITAGAQVPDQRRCLGFPPRRA